MIPQSLVFLLTYKCNFNCDHCSVCAGPNNHETISESKLKKEYMSSFFPKTGYILIYIVSIPPNPTVPIIF